MQIQNSIRILSLQITLMIGVLMTGAASVGFGANGSLILSLKNSASTGTIPWGRVSLKGPVTAAKDVNSAGEVEFIGLPSGKYLIEVRAGGFQTFRDTYPLDFSIRKRILHTLLMSPNKPVSFGKGKSRSVKPVPESPAEPATVAANSGQEKKTEAPKLQTSPLPEIPVPGLPVIPKEKTTGKKESQKKTNPVPGEIIHKNIAQESIIEDVNSTVSKIREREDQSESVITFFHLGPPLMVKLSFSDRSGLIAESPVTGMIVTGIVGTLALVLAGVFLTIVVLGRKSMLGLLKLVWCGCCFILLLLSVASWLTFAGFGVALFDIRVKEAAEERYRMQYQVPPDQEPGEGSDVILVPQGKKE